MFLKPPIESSEMPENESSESSTLYWHRYTLPAIPQHMPYVHVYCIRMVFLRILIRARRTLVLTMHGCNPTPQSFDTCMENMPSFPTLPLPSCNQKKCMSLGMHMHKAHNQRTAWQWNVNCHPTVDTAANFRYSAEFMPPASCINARSIQSSSCATCHDVKERNRLLMKLRGKTVCLQPFNCLPITQPSKSSAYAVTH